MLPLYQHRTLIIFKKGYRKTVRRAIQDVHKVEEKIVLSHNSFSRFVTTLLQQLLGKKEKEKKKNSLKFDVPFRFNINNLYTVGKDLVNVFSFVASSFSFLFLLFYFLVLLFLSTPYKVSEVLLLVLLYFFLFILFFFFFL